MKNKILITGVGGPTPLGIAKSLRLKYTTNEIKIIGIDADSLAPGLYNNKLFNETYLVPNANSKDYWDSIENIIQKEKIDYSFVVPEVEVLIWAQRQKASTLPCQSLIPDLNVAEIFYDKYKTFDLLKGTDLVPITIKIQNGNISQEINKRLGFPFWIRGGSGCGAIGSLKIYSHDDLNNWLNLNPHINDFVASEFLPGKNFACKLLYYNGDLIRAASAERVGYLLANAAPSGISGMCAHGKLINNELLVEKSHKAISIIFDKFGKIPHGMFTVDFKGDNDGIPKITEINIRHVSFTYAFALGGANFAADTLSLLINDPMFDKNFRLYKYDKQYTFIRGVDSELFIIEDEKLKKLK